MKPPWEWSHDHRAKMTTGGRDQLDALAVRLCMGRSRIIDALLRGMDLDTQVEVIQAQLGRDGAARAAWASTD